MARVFISYSTKDRSVVTRIASDLREAGATVWLAEWDIGVGDDIRLRIEQGIESCEYFLIALSENAVNSRWVQHELTAGLVRYVEGTETVLLPAKLSECRIPLLIAGKKYADFSHSYDRGLTELLDAIGAVGCCDRSSEISKVYVARRGEGGKRASPIVYANLGTGSDLVVHWLLESVGEHDAAIAATQEAYHAIRGICEPLLARADFMLRRYPGAFMTLAFSVIDLVLKYTPTNSKQDLGTKGVLAIKAEDVVHVSTMGSCGGFARCRGNSAEIKHLYRRIDPEGQFAAFRITGSNADVVSSAPLGHLETDEAQVQEALKRFYLEKPKDTIGHLALNTASFPLVDDSDFVALTSFVVPKEDHAIRSVIARLGDSDRCPAAARICEFRPQRASDCVCALLKR